MVDFEPLYEENKYVVYLDSPSNLSRGWYSFDESIKRYAGSIPPDHSIIKIHQVLAKLWNTAFEIEKLLNEYLEAVSEEDFQTKTIYRMPLIAFSYVSLNGKLEKYISKGAENYRKSIRTDTLFNENDNGIEPIPYEYDW